jgi:hypothetical protein
MLAKTKSQKIQEFFEFVGVQNHFSTPKEQWRNGAAESTINSIMLIARTVMAESGLGGLFWFKAAAAGTDALNATFKALIKMSPHQALFRAPKDVSRFRAFLCKVVVYLNKERPETGKHTARGIDAINLGFACKTNAYVLYSPERKTLMTLNQVKFHEHEFPMVEQFLSDNSTDILFKAASDVKWVVYNKLHVGNYSKVHHDKVSDVIVLQVYSQENTFTRVLMHTSPQSRDPSKFCRNSSRTSQFRRVSKALVQESTRISSQETIKKP